MKIGKFRIGQIVYHRGKNTSGIVVEVFQSDAGFRYYVEHSGFKWSVPEKALLADFTSKDSRKSPNKISHL